MAGQPIQVPDIGDFEAVEVIEVLIAVGDTVEQEQALITLESDKATLEVPSPVAGTITEVKIGEGDKVSAGDVIAQIEAAAGDGGAQSDTADTQAADAGQHTERRAAGDETETEAETEAETGDAEPASARQAVHYAAAPARTDARPGSRLTPVDEQAFAKAHASPGVRKYARELGVELGRVRGSGRKQRIRMEDINAYVKATVQAAERGGAGGGLPDQPAIDYSQFGEVETVELARIRKLSGKAVHRNWLLIPHVTQFDAADITEMEAFRKAHKADADRQGIKLTLLAFLLKASAAALQAFPDLNSSLAADGEHLIHKRYCHIGVAVDTEGGLTMPVLRDVDRKGIFALARELGELSGRARAGKLRPDDMKGACFSISSLGGVGGTAFTPIVNSPEVAILGVSRAEMRPVWQDEAFVPRLMLPLSLSYDHRVIDGAQAARITNFLTQVLGDLRTLLL